MSPPDLLGRMAHLCLIGDKYHKTEIIRKEIDNFYNSMTGKRGRHNSSDYYYYCFQVQWYRFCLLSRL